MIGGGCELAQEFQSPSGDAAFCEVGAELVAQGRLFQAAALKEQPGVGHGMEDLGPEIEEWAVEFFERVEGAEDDSSVGSSLRDLRRGRGGLEADEARVQAHELLCAEGF